MAIISTRVHVLPLDEIETSQQSATVKKHLRYIEVESMAQNDLEPIELANLLNLLQT